MSLAISAPFEDQVRELLAQRKAFLDLTQAAQQTETLAERAEVEQRLMLFVFEPLGIKEFSEVTLKQLNDDALVKRLMYLGGALELVLGNLLEATDRCEESVAGDNHAGA